MSDRPRTRYALNHRCDVSDCSTIASWQVRTADEFAFLVARVCTRHTDRATAGLDLFPVPVYL